MALVQTVCLEMMIMDAELMAALERRGSVSASGSDNLFCTKIRKDANTARDLDPNVADLCIFGHNVSLPGHTEVEGAAEWQRDQR